MKEDIINAYRIDNEEARLQSTLSRKVEYYSTIEALEPYCEVHKKVLDIGCGVGIYSLYLAEKGMNVTAIDIVPEHIEKLNAIIKSDYSKLPIKAIVGSADNLSEFEDEDFDIVLCMGPLYHMTSIDEQKKCLNECIRVSKVNAILFFSYISPYSVFPCVIRGDITRISNKLVNRIIDDHKVYANDSCCFWTDNYFHVPDEIEKLLLSAGLLIKDHLATDGQSIAFQSVINSMSKDEFEIWMEYHRKICRIPSVIGNSNHGLIIAEKE